MLREAGKERYKVKAKTLMYFILLLPNTTNPLRRWSAQRPRAAVMLFLQSCPSIAALLLSIFFQCIQCAPATSPLPSRPIYSLPPLDPAEPLNASSNGNCAETARYPSWNAKDWVVEDCYTAVQQLYFMEVLSHPDVPYEFIAPGVSPTRSPLESVKTPRKYIVRKLIGGLRFCCH